MRVFMVLLALVAMPFVASVVQAQGGHVPSPFSDPKNCALHLMAADAAGKQAPVHGGKHGVMDSPCASEVPPPEDPPNDPPPPPSPTCAVSSPPGSIEGQVYVDAYPWPGLSGWCVQLSGVTDAGVPVSATVGTDGSGSYAFKNIPTGTYTVCEVLQDGWEEKYPTTAFGGVTCPAGVGTGIGWRFTYRGGTAGFNNFGNLQATQAP